MDISIVVTIGALYLAWRLGARRQYIALAEGSPLDGASNPQPKDRSIDGLLLLITLICVGVAGFNIYGWVLRISNNWWAGGAVLLMLYLRWSLSAWSAQRMLMNNMAHGVMASAARMRKGR
jgi:hypothetical protein